MTASARPHRWLVLAFVLISWAVLGNALIHEPAPDVLPPDPMPSNISAQIASDSIWQNLDQLTSPVTLGSAAAGAESTLVHPQIAQWTDPTRQAGLAEVHAQALAGAFRDTGASVFSGAREATGPNDIELNVRSIPSCEEAVRRVVAVDRGSRVQTDRRDDLLSHLFQPQTHHPGQVHGLRSAVGISPPQLDEFIVGDDARARSEDMALLGWSEADLVR